MDEPAVQELLKVMAAHNAPGQEDLLAVFQQIAGLEKQLNAAVEELAAMRRELAQARESPVKRTLRPLLENWKRAWQSCGNIWRG